MSEHLSDSNDWLARYVAIADTMADVQRLCPRVAALGVSTLSPRHPPPPDQVQLVRHLVGDARESSNGAPRSPRRIRVPALAEIAGRWLWCLLFAIRETFGILYLKLRFAPQLRRAMRDPADMVLKTWCVSPESTRGSADFYYGTLTDELRARGVSSVLLCGDARGPLDARFCSSVLRRREVRAVPEQLLVPLGAPCAIAFRQLLSALSLRRIAKRATSRRVARVSAAASLGCLQPMTMRNTLQHGIARAAVRAWHPKAFVTFYEGQPWERCAWQGVKAEDPLCVLVGYQHTVVLPHALAVLDPGRSAARPRSPDVVLCLGDITRTMMMEGHGALGTRLIRFGTFRRIARDAKAPGPRPEGLTVIVLPEGFLSEARLLFGFAMRVAAMAPEHRFIFRSHPVFPFDRVRPYLEDVPERFANIELAGSDPIASDFDRSSTLLYRGSSSVLYAVLRGLKPVYVRDREVPDVDPLFELTDWRERVASPDEAVQRLRDFARVPDAEAIGPWRSAAKYVDAYTQPVDGEAIDRFVAAIGVRPPAETCIINFGGLTP